MLNRDAVLHIAELSKLKLTNEEADKYGEQMSALIGYFEHLSQVNTEAVEPLIHHAEIALHVREDIVRQNDLVEEMMSNAPEVSGNLFKVPPVV